MGLIIPRSRVRASPILRVLRGKTRFSLHMLMTGSASSPCGGMAYTTDLKSVAERLAGSNPATGTISRKNLGKLLT